ncbi:hypothetical protein ACFU6S_18960 [Streptomyces sp. NPDC057456]|uniref:hypothetical protein n=1 Tax=Streptomyces sp. NPDC057456 TaxID=3346139 RepID=UPI0036840717
MPTIMALDLFGRRWSLHIIRELHQAPPTSAPTATLRRHVPQRPAPAELAQAGLVAQQSDSSYTLTAVG